MPQYLINLTIINDSYRLAIFLCEGYRLFFCQDIITFKDFLGKPGQLLHP